MQPAVEATTPLPSASPRGQQVHAPFRTAKQLEALRPKAEPYELAEAGRTGLRLRVSPDGGKVFRWYVKAGGQRRCITIGPWSLIAQPGFVTLRQARERLEALKTAHTGGTLDAAVAELRADLGRSRPGQIIADAPEDTVKVVAEDFYQRRIVPKRRKPLDARTILDKDILPAIGSRSLGSLTAKDCAAVVEAVVDRGAKAHAGKVLGLLKQLLGFAERRDLVQRNVAARLDPDDLGVVHGIRKRWLSAEEIPIFWRALDADRGPQAVSRPDPRTGKVQTYEQRLPALAPATRTALRILLLTCVRTGELLKAKWEHVDFGAATWTVPVENQKMTRDQERNAKPWVIPLTPSTLALFRVLKAEAGDSAWVMASKSSERKDQERYDDKSLGHALRRIQRGAAPALVLPGGEVCPHDLRRSARTHLGKLRVPLHVVERCLNHRFGKIAETYDQNDYLDERREALERWDAYLRGLLEAGQAKVVPLQVAGA